VLVHAAEAPREAPTPIWA